MYHWKARKMRYKMEYFWMWIEKKWSLNWLKICLPSSCKASKTKNLPSGHFPRLHNSLSTIFPWQKRPVCGFGLLHSRFRFRRPFPHVLEQVVHWLHSDQPPSTWRTKNLGWKVLKEYFLDKKVTDDNFLVKFNKFKQIKHLPPDTVKNH
jgi:hypothetical protein